MAIERGILWKTPNDLWRLEYWIDHNRTRHFTLTRLTDNGQRNRYPVNVTDTSIVVTKQRIPNYVMEGIAEAIRR